MTQHSAFSIALVTSSALSNLHPDDHLLVQALDDIGIGSTPIVWSDQDVDWMAFDALVFRSPWDYFERLQEFRRWLNARMSSGVTLINSGRIISWNFDKVYLTELETAGVRIVPSIVIPIGDAPDIKALLEARGWTDFVIKPTISGGAYGTVRLTINQIEDAERSIGNILKDRGVIIQPFLSEILKEGELSLLFFDGEFSHAVCKRAVGGDYRVQFQYGGTTEPVDVTTAIVSEARKCIDALPDKPVYARVDGLANNGQFMLMELEVFEPLMFLEHHPDAPSRFAAAIKKRLIMSSSG